MLLQRSRGPGRSGFLYAEREDGLAQAERAAVVGRHHELCIPATGLLATGVNGLAISEPDRRLGRNLAPGFGGHGRRASTVLSEEAVRSGGKAVPAKTAIDHQHGPPGAAELLRRGNSGEASADDDDVMRDRDVPVP